MSALAQRLCICKRCLTCATTDDSPRMGDVSRADVLCCRRDGCLAAAAPAPDRMPPPMAAPTMAAAPEGLGPELSSGSKESVSNSQLSPRGGLTAGLGGRPAGWPACPRIPAEAEEVEAGVATAERPPASHVQQHRMPHHPASQQCRFAYKYAVACWSMAEAAHLGSESQALATPCPGGPHPTVQRTGPSWLPQGQEQELDKELVQVQALAQGLAQAWAQAPP